MVRIVKLDKYVFITSRFEVSGFLGCDTVLMGYCSLMLWRNVLPASARVEGSIPLELLSPWRWVTTFHFKCQDTLTQWQRDIPEDTNQVFLRFYELKLLSQDVRSEEGWDDHLCEPLCHIQSISWYHLHFPYSWICYTSKHSLSVTAYVTDSETGDVWKKQPLKKFWFCMKPIDNQHFELHLLLVFKFQILVLVKI